MSIFVRFWGTRGSIPTPGMATRKYGGNTSCYELRVDDTLFILDGGTGLRDLGMHLMQRGRSPVEAHMFFSHTHWDHIQGFPFFPAAYSKDSKLYVYDVEEGDRRIHRLLHGQMSADYFPVAYSDLGASIISRDLQPGQEVDGVEVDCLEQEHPGRSFAFSFRKHGVKVVYATDAELDLQLLNQEESLAEPSALRQLPPEVVQFVSKADLLIADGQYSDQEYPSKVGWGHARSNTVVDLAVQAQVKQLAITHHDPMHSDDAVERKITEARQRAESQGSDLVVFGGREGLEIKLH